MADSTDFMTRGREVAGKLWGTAPAGRSFRRNGSHRTSSRW